MKQSNPNEKRAVRRIILSVASALAISAIAAGIWIFSRDVPSAHAGEAGRASIVEAFRHELPNVPGRSLVGLAVTYPPGSKTPSHHHAPSAFITGFVLSGAIRSQVDDGPVQVFRTGESWAEMPGTHHRVSENASGTEPASLLAIFVLDSKETQLTTIDKD